ncbi:MAG: hypothetical protein JOY59_00695, partial [Candidatus Eremiobacteraeota bacterium]|nr:hypothetical protein [Candidatus Eremiobacteraeota bacterium]
MISLALASATMAPANGAAHEALSARIAAERAAFQQFVARNSPAKAALEALQLDKRLGDDADTLGAPTPDGYTSDDWEETLANLVAADSELVDQIVGSVSPFSLQPGLHERLIRSAQDSEIDAVAIYEPA